MPNHTNTDHFKTITLAPDCGNDTLLELLRPQGIQLHAPCGGNGTCKQCLVNATGRLVSLAGEFREVKDEDVLACRWRPDGPVTLRVKQSSGENDHIAADRRPISGGGEGLGLAVDIGTTTVAVYLYDLSSGRCINTACAMNAQRSFGSDVISRIQHCEKPGGLEELSRVIRDQLRELARSICPELSRIRFISIAANTVMEHIFAGLSPVSIGVAPFTPESLFGREYPASDFLTGFAEDARLYLAPCVAGYVGGDITAGLMSSGAYLSDKTVLFLDIGTNGEMAIGDKNGFLCCATAAGPAFEGAEIACGSPARDGAINSVSRDLSFTTLGDVPPVSICGSGIIDGVAALLCNEIVDETGRMDSDKYFLGDKVYLSSGDIRKIQLAKGAIRAGIETLLALSQKSYDDIDRVLIAGGFGAYLRVESACAIGLLPPAFLHKTQHVGNSSGAGAAMALTPGCRTLLDQITQKCRYVELSGSAVFNDKYIEAMMFDEWEDVYND